VNLNDLADLIADELYPTFRETPFAIFGHSMGATLGFEVARNLTRRYGLFPKALFVSGRPAPQLARTRPPTYNLPEPEFLAEIRRMNGTPREVTESEELMSVLIPLLRADFEAIQTYQYRSTARLPCPIMAFGGLDDKDVPREALEAWRPNTVANFKLELLPGDHFFLHSQREALLRLLGDELAKYGQNESVRPCEGSQPRQATPGRSVSVAPTLKAAERCVNR
jgi:medium-chain acyl-[acyl-carrier-protein] hydrolase